MSHSPEVWPGQPHPQGATYDGRGVNFAVYSDRATRVEVCLFDQQDPSREVARFSLPTVSNQIHHGYVQGLKPGALYGLRVYGPYTPEEGLRFNPSKLLVDPYARALHGKVDWKAPLVGYQAGGEDEDLSFDPRDDAWGVPRSVVVTDEFDWGSDAPPRTPWTDSILYELHVKGFTKRHPEVPASIAGTYSGLAHPAVIAHFKKLGITAVELLPVHECVDEGFLSERGLTNYWGYNTLGYFAPDQRFSSQGSRGGQITDFKTMVKGLHAAGIEVILDVVYNHTGEGNQLGPTLSFRGIDNSTYYRLRPDEPRATLDFTGCGNSLNVRHAQALTLVADSLRYWVEQMHVDGFRFDLATTLGRELFDFDRSAAFFQVVHQDPVLSRVKLIAEPWDLGDGGYQVANFPILWSEWNGRYKDAVRRFWRGDENLVAELGYRLTGSSDLYQLGGRGPSASINYVAVHDGFTLADAVSYNEKHNEANREENKDGSPDNHSWNCGVEGPSQDPRIEALRDRQIRNFLLTLFVSQGVPMLCAGDEVRRTQQGNNNAYCQDNELSWMSWQWDDRAKALFDFTCQLVRFRKEQVVLRRGRFFQGDHIWDSAFKDLAWFRADGREMMREDWDDPSARAMTFLLGGDAIPSQDGEGRRIVGDTLLVLLNANPTSQEVTLPTFEWGKDWEVVFDTAATVLDARHLPAVAKVQLVERSAVVLRHPSGLAR